MLNGVPKYTVDEALASIGFGRFQVFVLAYSGMGWVAEAMEMMLLSFVGPSVQLEWGLSSHKESLITSVVFVGMLIGAYTWGIILDIYGRRKGFLFTAIVTSGAGLLSAFAPNYYSLIFLHFLVGIGLGGGPVLLSWFLEFVPTPERGFWLCVFSGFWTIGTILEASIAWVLMRVEQEQKVTEDAQICAEQDVATLKYAAHVLQIYTVSIIIRIVVCSLTLVNLAYTLLVLNYCFFFRVCNIINPARPVKLKV